MSTKKTTAELIKERPSAEEIKNLPRTPINIVVDNIRSLDNVGLIFRLCELARVEKLYLTGYTGHPEFPGDTREDWLKNRHTRRIEKTAVYAVPHQPWEYVLDPLPLVQDLKKRGSQIVALEQTKTSVPYYKAEYKTPLTLIVGHEREGIRPELLSLAETIIEIPILGIGNSHNVATATGIVLNYMVLQTGLYP